VIAAQNGTRKKPRVWIRAVD